jgi:type IV pilus assembly protein PilA
MILFNKKGIFMKKNKGFTLIELLAIIVILAIIAVITVPIILNIIENSRKGAAQDSAYGYKDAVDKYYVTELSTNHNLKLEGTYTVTNGVLNGTGITNKTIPISGTTPSSGSLTYENNVLKTGCLTIGDYAVTFNADGTTSLEKGECSGVEQGFVEYYTYGQDYQTQLDNSWNTYAKKITDGYALEDMNTDTRIGVYNTLEECWTAEDENTPQRCQEPQESLDPTCPAYSCEPINERHEVCGVESGQTFCLKPNEYSKSVNTLNKIFNGCGASTSNNESQCVGTNVTAYAANDGYVVIDNSTYQCDIQNGFSSCYVPHNIRPKP